MVNGPAFVCCTQLILLNISLFLNNYSSYTHFFLSYTYIKDLNIYQFAVRIYESPYHGYSMRNTDSYIEVKEEAALSPATMFHYSAQG